MDKLRILRSAESSGIMDGLKADEIRLYLILLANCTENGEGRMLVRAINGVIGKGFSMDNLKAACNKLADCGLLEISPAFPERLNDKDLKLAYKIIPSRTRSEPGKK